MIRTIDANFSKGRSLKDLRLSNVTITKEINLPDDVKLKLGTDNDFEFFHDSATDTHTINISKRLRLVNDSGFVFARLQGSNGAFIDFHRPDTDPLGEVDFRIEHDGNTSLKSSAGNFNIVTQKTSDNPSPQPVRIRYWDTSVSPVVRYEMAKFIPAGAVETYHNNVKQFESTATGLRLNTATVPSGTSQPAGLSSGDIWYHSSNTTLHMVP